MRSHGTPAVRHRTAATAFEDPLRMVEAVVGTQEGFPVGVETVDRRIHAIESIVVAALAVLRLVVDDTAFHFHLAGGQIALEVLHVGLRVPQAPFHEREKLEMPGRGGPVRQRDFVDLAALSRRDEEQHVRAQAVLFPRDAGVSHPVPALVEVQGRAAGFPSGSPDRVAVLDIKIAAAAVHRYAIVAVAQDTPVAGVAAEAVAARRIGNQGKEVVGAQVIDPGPGRCGVGNDILPALVIEMTVLLWDGLQCFMC